MGGLDACSLCRGSFVRYCVEGSRSKRGYMVLIWGGGVVVEVGGPKRVVHVLFGINMGGGFTDEIGFELNGGNRIERWSFDDYWEMNVMLIRYGRRYLRKKREVVGVKKN